MGCQDKSLVVRVSEIFDSISNLESLKPSDEVNKLFTQLVNICMPPNPIDVTKLCQKMQEMRSSLIKLCGEAEGYMESHFSSILGSYENPLQHVSIFPYYGNYLKLSLLEYTILNNHSTAVPASVAFIGSGPLPLTSIVLASYHLKTTAFHNYDIDSSANAQALKLVSSDPDLSSRMFFHTSDIMDVTKDLYDYDVVFLAALVGMDIEDKVRVIEHLAKFMAPGAILMLRSAHGARGFLYPIVDPCDLLGFEVLSVFHPTDEVINSVVIARKYASPRPLPVVNQGLTGNLKFPSKCCEIPCFNPLHHGHIMEELTIEDQRN